MWMIKSQFDSLNDAIKNPGRCKALKLLFIKKDLGDSGPNLAMLKNLRELFIQADPSIYDNYEFEVPPEIGELTELKKLSLLNVPFKNWPTWVFKLKHLEYLMIRGTEIDSIPCNISRLTELKTLRVENCEVTKLPSELRDLRKLKNLGLSDTKLSSIDKNDLPLGLRKINLAGTKLFASVNEIVDRRLKSAHVN
jgi:hypothetical protein